MTRCQGRTVQFFRTLQFPFLHLGLFVLSPSQLLRQALQSAVSHTLHPQVLFVVIFPSVHEPSYESDEVKRSDVTKHIVD